MVADQVGCPTATHTLASACWRAIGADAAGGLSNAAAGNDTAGNEGPRILHWSDAGAASWYDFAVAIGELGVAAGLLERAAAVKPLTTADYPTPAERPSYSLLECSGTRQALDLPALHWRQALRKLLEAVAWARPLS